MAELFGQLGTIRTRKFDPSKAINGEAGTATQGSSGSVGAPGATSGGGGPRGPGADATGNVVGGVPGVQDATPDEIDWLKTGAVAGGVVLTGIAAKKALDIYRGYKQQGMPPAQAAEAAKTHSFEWDAYGTPQDAEWSENPQLRGPDAQRALTTEQGALPSNGPTGIASARAKQLTGPAPQLEAPAKRLPFTPKQNPVIRGQPPVSDNVVYIDRGGNAIPAPNADAAAMASEGAYAKRAAQVAAGRGGAKVGMQDALRVLGKVIR